MAMVGWLLAGLVLVYIAFNWKLHEHIPHWFRSGRPSRRRPQVGHEAVSLDSGGASLKAWWTPVPAGEPTRAALLIFHGNQETIGDWVDTLALLHRHGVATLIFDYAGFGTSSGRPSVAQMRRDGAAALREFLRRAPAGVRRYALGFSMGGAVMLESVLPVQRQLTGIILSGAYASVRSLAPDLFRAPRWLARLLPDFHNSLKRVPAIKRPLLIVHSRHDDVVPAWHAQELVQAAPMGLLHLVDAAAHNDIFRGCHPAYWTPMLTFMQVAPGAVASRPAAAAPRPALVEA